MPMGTKQSFTKEVTAKFSFENLLRVCQAEDGGGDAILSKKNNAKSIQL